MRNSILSIFLICALGAFSQNVRLSVQTGHSSTINKVIFSPDDQLVVTAGADHKIVVWDIVTGKQYGVFLGHKKSVTDIAFSHDGKQLYSVSTDSTLKIWDFNSETLIKSIPLEQPIGSMTLDEKNDRLIMGGKRICTFDIETENCTQMEFRSKELFTSICLSEDGNLLAVGGEDEKFMYLIDLKNVELIKKFVTSVKDINIEQNEKLLFTTTDGRLVEYTLKTRKRNMITSDWMLNSINALETNDQTIYACNNIGEVYMLNRDKKWKSVGKFKMKRGKVNDITTSHDGKFLAAAGENRTVVIWDLETNKVTKSLKGTVEQINDIEFSRDGSEIIIAYNDGTVRLSNLISNQTLVNSLRPKSDILSTFSSYAVQRIEHLGFDTITFSCLFKINSLVYEGVFDQIEKYHLTWDLNNNLLSFDKVKKDKLIKQYIKDLKVQKFHDEDYFLDKTLMVDKNDSIHIEAKIERATLLIKDLKTNKIIHTIETGHSDKVTSVAINPIYNYVATASWDGMIRFWDIETGDLLTVYGAFGNGQFVYLDRSGYYFASKDALDYIGFKLDNKLYSFEQFDLKYNRPDIIAKSLPYFNETYVTAYYGAYKKRLKKLGLKEKDVGITTDLPDLEVEDEVKEIERIEFLELTIKCEDKASELDKLHIRVNGVPEFGRFGKQLAGNKYEKSFKIALNPGTNYVQVYVTNVKGVSSYKKTIEIESHQKVDKPDLYLITLGVSKFEQSQYDLKYARKDAEDIISFFKGTKLQFKKIHTKKLVDDEVTIENVEELKNFASHSKSNDVFIFFAAGHGVLDVDLDYYFASYDMDFMKPQERGIPYDLFEQILDESKSRKKVMFLDACHSGEIDKDEVVENVVSDEEEGDLTFRGSTRSVSNKYDINSFELSRSLFADMRLNNGSTVVSSAGGAEFAIEGDEWNNGVFTFCMLKGLRDGEADLNNDKVIMLSELQKFVQNEVIKISKGRQTPTSRVENLNNDFRLK